MYAVPTALEVLLEWEAVMLVTVTEAYVQDVLAFAAERDAALMKDSDQTAAYHEVSQAQSVTDLATELRRRWARNFLEDGGPRRWAERFERMGARGFKPDVGETMELHWGVRHVVVHNASKATAEFVRRHPGFGAVADQPLQVERPMLSKWFGAIQSLSETVERSCTIDSWDRMTGVADADFLFADLPLHAVLEHRMGRAAMAAKEYPEHALLTIGAGEATADLVRQFRLGVPTLIEGAVSVSPAEEVGLTAFGNP